MNYSANHFKKNGYNVIIEKDEDYFITIKDKGNSTIIYRGSFRDCNDSTIEEIFNELRLN